MTGLAEFDVTKVVAPSLLGTRRDQGRHIMSQRIGYLRLDKNENFAPIDETALAQFRNGLTQETLSAYPDLCPIYRRLSEMAGVGEDQLLLAAGSDQAIKAVFDTCLGPGDHIVLHRPSYFMYEIYAQRAGAGVDWVPVAADGHVDTAAMLQIVRPETKMVVVEDPVGMLGTLSAESDLVRLAHALAERDVVLAIDEAYLYVRRDRSPYLNLLHAPGNVVLIHTLSKAHGLAGGRIGFAIGNPAIMEFVNRARPLYEIGGLQAWAANWCLGHPQLLSEFRDRQAAARRYLFPVLEKLEIEYRDTAANFVLIRPSATQPDMDLFAELARRRVLVREIRGCGSMDGWYRVTLQNEACCRVLAYALADIIEAAGCRAAEPPKKTVSKGV